MRAGFARVASDAPGRLVAAICDRAGADPMVLGEDRLFHAWSTIKVPVLVALLTVVHRDALAPEHSELARRAVTESDNRAILELFVLLEDLTGGSEQAAVVIERLFRLSGDHRTRVAPAPPPPGAITPFGQTGWSAADSARFLAALAAGRLLDASGTGYVLGLMELVTPEQRWGLGELASRAAFKGGWGPETGGTCLVRQSGVLLDAGTAISLVVEPPAGGDPSEAGVRALSRTASLA